MHIANRKITFYFSKFSKRFQNQALTAKEEKFDFKKENKKKIKQLIEGCSFEHFE